MAAELATSTVWVYLLVFCRIGAALLFMPGFGEIYITPRARLLMALVLSVAAMPLVAPLMPPITNDFLQMVLYVSYEIIIGLYIGLLMRVVQGLVHITGMIIAFQSSLASALLFDATQGSQGSVVGNFMTITATTLLFVSDLHHVMIAAIVHSFDMFRYGQSLPVEEFKEVMGRTLSDGFVIAFKMSAPLTIIGLCVFLAGGLMGRLMPNMQVFFVIIPLQIYVGFFFVAATLTTAMMLYLRFFEDTIRLFVP